MKKLSGCVFIRNTFEGAYCLWESLATLMPVVDEMIVLDLGSTDGTLEVLKEVRKANSKLKILQASWPKIDAGVFADLANDLIARCTHDQVLYFQSDEIWHEDLVALMLEQFAMDQYDLKLWRIQFRDNFQEVKWFPHPVHRVGYKNNFHFVDDGMNTDRYLEPVMCSNFGMEYFSKWSSEYGQEGIKPFVHEMITDVSLIGGFLGNIRDRRTMHAPFWGNDFTIDGLHVDDWLNKQAGNDRWTKTESPYNIPALLRWHVGKSHYTLQPGILERMKEA